MDFFLISLAVLQMLELTCPGADDNRMVLFLRLSGMVLTVIDLICCGEMA